MKPGHLTGLCLGALICLGILTGCDTVSEPMHSEESLPVEIDYEYSEWADVIRLSNPYWANERTLGWLEMHYFMQEQHRPHPDVKVVYWKVEQDVETLDRTETLYHVSAINRRWSGMAGFRYSEGIFVRIGSHRYSDVIYRGGWRRISPGNDLDDTGETFRHVPIDFADGQYLYGHYLRREGRELRLSRLNENGESLLWSSSPIPPDNFDFTAPRAANPMWIIGRLVSPEQIILCDPIRGSDGREIELRFHRVDVPSGERNFLGRVGTDSGAKNGWNIFLREDGPIVLMSHIFVSRQDVEGRPLGVGTIVARLDSDVVAGPNGGALKWFPKIEYAVFSPDGKRVAGRTTLTWRSRYPDADDRSSILTFMAERNEKIQGHAVYELD